eukprot:882813-Amphidinium_carterae.1
MQVVRGGVLDHISSELLARRVLRLCKTWAPHNLCGVNSRSACSDRPEVRFPVSEGLTAPMSCSPGLYAGCDGCGCTCLGGAVRDHWQRWQDRHCRPSRQPPLRFLYLQASMHSKHNPLRVASSTKNKAPLRTLLGQASMCSVEALFSQDLRADFLQTRSEQSLLASSCALTMIRLMRPPFKTQTQEHCKAFEMKWRQLILVSSLERIGP